MSPDAIGQKMVMMFTSHVSVEPCRVSLFLLLNAADVRASCRGDDVARIVGSSAGRTCFFQNFGHQR